MKTLAEIKCIVARIVQLEKLMDAAMDDPSAWKRTLGCPGTRYLPEWEKLMEQVTTWLGKASESSVESLDTYESELRK